MMTAHRQSYALLSIGVALAYAAILFWGGGALQSQVRDASTSVADRTAARERNRLTAVNGQQLERLLETSEERFQTLTDALVRRDDAYAFITSLEADAAASGVQMTFGIPEITENASGVQPVPLRFDVIGTYPALMQFLTRLEQRPQYFNASVLTFSRLGEENQAEQVKLSFDAVTYWQ
ncbi:MAG: type 4a pilus biogenesis protein PilO [Candidatus Kerfeldbacteria bacterium]|nr:type 4a pilus biogenesis protein PilO [Candidatus Kerfeldbacteria bacterium]